MSRKRIWYKDKVLLEAQKYQTRNEFSQNARGAYKAAKHNGWLEEACSHMPKKAIWNKENAFAEAKKYSTRFELQKHSRSAYNALVRNNWLKEACAHMPLVYKRHKQPKKPNYWTKSLILKEISKYKTITEFATQSSGAYEASKRLGIINIIKEHLPGKKWTKEKLQQEALKYSYRGDFQKHSQSACIAARRLEIYEEICSHMKPKVKAKVYTKEDLLHKS